MKDLDESFESFAILLRERVCLGIFTTEDAIRYLFFLSVMRTLYVSSNEILLESEHPADSKKQVDMVVVRSETRPELVFEFKFHRYTGSMMGLPNNAGQLFKDVFRLAMYKNRKESSGCFAIYVTDSKMVNYFRNPRNKLDDFFNLNIGKRLKIDENYVKNHADTFIDKCGRVCDCEVSMRFKKDYDDLSIRIFEIENTSAKN